MSLPIYLKDIKHSGIYRFVFDKSEMIEDANVSTLRLVVGYSEKGPFNTPVLIKNSAEFKTVFGDVSKKLERYGCFFHRSALQCLKTGEAILALNIKPFDGEKVEGFNININETISTKVSTLVKDLYNTDRFWFLDPEHLEDLMEDKYLMLTTTDGKEASSNTIFMRGYVPKNYDITFKEYFSSVIPGEIPTYLEGYEMEKLSNYFAEIYVFKGEFTKEIVASDLLSKYFLIENGEVKLKPYLLNAFGERIDTLTALANNEASNFIRSYNGILLPDFQGSNGAIISLDALFNQDHSIHKMLMRFNQGVLFNGIDDEPFDIHSLNTMGWSVDPERGTMSLSKLDHTICNVVYVDGAWKYDKTADDAIFYEYASSDVKANGTSVECPEEFASANFRVGDSFIGKDGIVTLTSATGTTYEFSGELPTKEMSLIKDGFLVYDKASFEKLPESYRANNPYTEEFTKPSLPWLAITFKPIHTDNLVVTVNGVEFNYREVGKEVELLTLDKAELVSKGILVEGESMVKTWNITISNGTTSESLELVVEDENADATTTIVGGVVLKKCIKSATATSANLVPTFLQGYTYTSQKPQSTSQLHKLEWQHKILDVLAEKGIRTALTNRVDCEYKYLVDTFEGFIESECKAKLAAVCKEKFNCLGLLNVPSMKTFSSCEYTSFRDNADRFNIEYIAKGGNMQRAMTRPFTLVSEENGASFVEYVTCLTIRDVVTNVKTIVPGAALLSNEYMRKHTSRFPYSIVAGPNHGRVTETGLIGPDFNYGSADLDVLEPMGINCYVYAPGKGTFINSQQTAKQNPVTALSKVHVRELCTFLQDEIEKMMQNYQWEFNNQRLRDEVKSKADVICETCKLNGGINAYINVCDSNNNTNELIEREFLILETEIEPGFGAGKMVQTLTIRNNGSISASISE